MITLGAGATATTVSSIVSLASSFSNFTSEAPTESGWVPRDPVIPCVMFLLGVVGNITALVILTVKPSRSSKTTAFYHLVKALAWVDLFGTCASSPVTITAYISGGIARAGGQPLCHYITVILIMAANGNMYTVLVMAAERFIVTKYPFQYSQIVTPVTVNLSIAVIWGVSLLIAVFPVIGVGTDVALWPGTWCFFDYRSKTLLGKAFSYFYAIVGLLTVTTSLLLNLSVIYHLWYMRSRLIRSSLSTKEYYGIKRPDTEIRMVIFLMAITVLFTLFYTPLMIRILINQTFNSDSNLTAGGTEDNMDLWALRAACLNQILDPWIYIICRFTCCKGQQGRDSCKIYHPRDGTPL